MKKSITVLLILILTLPVLAQQEQFIFIEVDGIPGESTDARHANWIDALAFSGGASNNGSAQIVGGGGAGTGKVNVQDYAFSICLDLSSIKLRESVQTGRLIPFINVDFAKKNTAGNITYARIRMEDVLVSSFSEGATTADGKTSVNITFNFARYRNTYIPIDPRTGTAGTPVVKGWDIAENRPW